MKKFGDNKIMRIFAVHFLSSRQRLMDAEAEFLGFKAVRQQECQVRLAPPSENLTASGKLFFYAIVRAAIARALWQKNKIRNFGNVQNS